MYLKSPAVAPVITVTVLPATGFEASRLVWLALLALVAGLVLVRLTFAEPLRFRASVGEVRW